jgi:hypothetical protein
VANHVNSGALNSGASFTVANFSSYTVYAASGSVVTAKVGGSTVATYTLPAANALTITDLADTVSVNASFQVVGLVSNSTV